MNKEINISILSDVIANKVVDACNLNVNKQKMIANIISEVFEERYSAYSKQLEIMLKGLRYYGYSVEYQDYETSIPEDKKEEIKEYLKGCRNRRFNYNTIQTFKFLDTINEGNIEEYKEILRGNYDIFKANKNMTEFGDQNLYVEDIEIVERNTPIVVG